MEKEACFILGLLAIKQEHQHAIADKVRPLKLPIMIGKGCHLWGGLRPDTMHQSICMRSNVGALQGALKGLVGLLKRYVPFVGPLNPGASVVRRAADAVTNLAHENVSIKSRVRAEGGIPPLVALLESYDAKV